MAITPQMARAELARRELARRQATQQPQDEMPIQQQQGLSSIPGDIADAGVNLFMGAGEKAMRLPDEAQAAAQQFAQHPLSAPPRAAQSVLSGLLEGGKQLFNLPLNINTYLGSKGIPLFKQTAPYAEKLKIGDTGLQKAVMGEQRPGDELFNDLGQLGAMAIAPEAAGARIPAVTSKGILKQLSKEKSKQLGIAKQDYGQLFSEAGKQGLSHAKPAKSVMSSQSDIIKNSQPKYHASLKKYLEDPTLENAHWAQSELGALKRHLDSISQKTGLTPSQIKTFKAVEKAQKGIRESMFSKNALGANPELAMKYEGLAKKYRENVIPYTRLEELSEVERGQMRPKTAIKGLMNDEQFMLDLAKKHPGVYLRTPTAKSLLKMTGGLMGYEEIKNLMRGK